MVLPSYFNSIKVRLELILQEIRVLPKLNFNSIKVRLELRYLRVTGINERFQFHKGAIRTFVFASVVPMPTNFNSIKVRLERNGLFAQNHVYLFQFHKGAIRTTAKSCSGSKGKNFNSIKVRLEPGFKLHILDQSAISIP